MNRYQRAVLVLNLAEELRKNKSWCGETHLQKAVYFLQELMQVPLGYEFIMYKHGPFSFDFRDELFSFMADGLIEYEIQNPYGPKLKPTANYDELKKTYPKTIGAYIAKIKWIAEKLGNKGVVDLEKLGTALYVERNAKKEGKETREFAEEIIKLKKHLTIEEAMDALKEVKEMEAAIPQPN